MYIGVECCLQNDILLVVFSVLLYSTFNVQILYKTVQSATELYLQ